MGKTFYHIFPANSPHLVKPISSNFLENMEIGYKQKVIVLGETTNDTYNQLLQDFPEQVYIFKSIKKLISFLRGNDYVHILVHGDMLYLILLLKIVFRKVSWVCWGTGTKTNKSLLSKVTYPIKWLLFHRLSSVITLMDNDMNDIINTYRINNVSVLPYATKKDTYRDDIKHFNKSQKIPLRVLIGNSGHNYDSYINILPILAKFKNKIEIHCMFQYPDLQEKKELLRKYGESLFGNTFIIDDCLMERHTYYDYMASYDIYICNKETQTGLGAIYYSLYIGKKVYVNGYNLSWCRTLGYDVFDTKSISSISFEDFSQDLQLERKIHNRDLYINFIKENSLDKWKLFLINLCK